MNEDQLCRKVIDKLGDKWAAYQEVKSGSTWGNNSPKRFDLLALKKSWTKPCIRIYEAKASRNTFLNDQKWTKYLDYCNEFYWLCPTGMIKKEEIDPRCGLVTVNPKSGAVYTRQKAVYRDADPKLQRDVLMYLFMWRIDAKAAWMITRERRIARIQSDIAENKKLGERYANYVSKTLNEAARRYEKKERSIIRREADLKRFREWCNEVGLNEYEVHNALKKDRIIKLHQSSNMYSLKLALKRMLQDMEQLSPGVKTLLEILEEKEDDR